MLEAEDWDAMVSLARNQSREGSHLIDVNVDYAGRDNASDMAQLVHRFCEAGQRPLDARLDPAGDDRGGP